MRESPGLKWLAIFCLATIAAALIFSQHAREMVTGLNASPALRHHLTGRKLFLGSFQAAPSAKFDDYDGHTNTAAHLRDDAWLATGFVEYAWQGSRRRERWSCAFDVRTRDVHSIEVGTTKETTPEFHRQQDRLRRGSSGAKPPSAADSIKETWGWKRP